MNITKTSSTHCEFKDANRISPVLQKHVIKDLCCCHTKGRIFGQSHANRSGCRLQIYKFSGMPKEGMGGSPADPSFGMTMTNIFNSESITNMCAPVLFITFEI